MVNVALLIHTVAPPDDSHVLLGLDASKPGVPVEKARLLVHGHHVLLLQTLQVGNPEWREP